MPMVWAAHLGTPALGHQPLKADSSRPPLESPVTAVGRTTPSCLGLKPSPPKRSPDPQPRSRVFPGLGARQVQDAARLKAARVVRLSATLHGGRTAISSLGEVRGTPRGEFPGHQLPRNTWDSQIYLTMKNMPSENS